MNSSHKKLTAAALAATVMLSAGACSRPDPNPAVRITGDKTEAIPATTAATTTEPVVTTTTLFYGPNGASNSSDESDNSSE